MNKHTPGPWQAHHDHGWLVVSSENEELYVQVEKGSFAKKRMADAALIAAAPDLLEELTYLVGISESAMRESNRDGGEYDVSEILSPARAAIAKATGEAK